MVKDILDLSPSRKQFIKLKKDYSEEILLVRVGDFYEAFDEDVAVMVDEAKKLFPDLEDLPEEAQQVIVNMTFNMGRPRLSKFKKFIAGVNAGDWEKAAVEMMDSRWAKQVGSRAERLRDRIRALA